MTKKTTKVDIGDMKFDSELDLSFDDEFGLVDVTRNKRKRQPIHDVARGLKDATKSRLKSAGFWDNLARKALPRSYTVISDEVKKSSESLSQIFRESSRTLKPELSRIGRQIDDLVPEESKRIKRWSKKLTREESSYAPPSAETLHNQAISDAQAHIFDKIHQHSDAREARDRAENRIKEKIDSKRFTTSVNILAGIHTDVARISSYTVNVDAAYKKKSLELQFHSYRVQSEMLREMARNNSISRAYFEAIKENTALPDFAKITKTEMFKQQALAEVFKGVQGGVAGGIQRVGKRLKGYAEEAKGRLGEISQGLDAAAMFRDNMKLAKEMGMDESMYYSVPATGGGILVDWLAGKAAPHIGKLFPKGGKASQRMAKAARVLHDPSNLAKSLRDRKGLQERMGAGGLKGIFAQFEHDILGDFIAPDRDKTLTSGREAGKLELAHFDHRVHRSITDIIPGYLMRILQETSTIRTGLGYKQGEMTTYDWKRGKFTNPRVLAKRIKDDIVNRPGNDSINYHLGETAKMMTGFELKDQEAVRVKQFIHKLAAKDSFEFTPENILASREFSKLRPDEQDMIRTQLTTKIGKNEENREFFSSKMNELRGSVDTQTNETMTMLSQLLKDMSPEELERAGLTKENESGGQDINLARVQTLLRKRAIDAKSIKPTEYKRPPPANDAGEHKYVGEIPNWTYDNATKRYNWTSDRNTKTNVRSASPKSLLERLKGLDLFNYQYRGKHRDDGRQHTGPMAQDVNRQFGNAAPGGVSIDDRAMSAIHTGAIKELNAKVENQIKDESAISLLRSIDARLAQLTTVGKLSIGFSPSEGDRGLFDDTLNLAGRYSKALFKKGREGINRGTNFITSSGQFLRDKVANPLWEGTKETWNNNKDQVKDGVSKVFSDLITLSGKAYDKGMDFVTNVVPNSLRSLNNLMKQGFEKTREYLSRPRDFYIPGMESPVLVGDFFSQGFYVDSEGKPILNLEDLKRVKGAVYKKTGEIAVTAEQMAQGLFDRYGNKLKNIATTLGGVASGAIGWASEKFMEGMDRIKDLFGGAGRVGKGLLSGVFGGMGLSGGGTLGKILSILTKWDRNGRMGGDDPLSPTSMLGNLGEIPSDTSGSSSFGSTPAGQPGSGFSGISSMAAGAQKLFTSETFKNSMSRVAASRGMQRLGGIGSMIGGLGGGRVGRMGSGLKGMLGTAAGALSGLLGGSSQEQPQSTPRAQVDPNTQQAAPKPENRSDLLKNISGMFNKGKAAWNDKDNSGRRDGDWRDRLDALNEAQKSKKTAENIRAPEGHRYSNGGIMGMLKGLFGMLSGGVGKLFSLAGSTLLGLGGVGKLLGGAAKGVGSVIKGAGSVAGAGGKLLGKVGGPLAKGIARIGASGIGRVIAGTAARTAVISGAASIMTGGIGSAVLGAVAAGITGLGAVLASPVALGALATGAAAYGGYKLYKYMTRGKVDDFQKFRYMQYGFGPDMADQYYQKLLGLETYFLSGRVGYRAQTGSANKVAYLLDSKIKSENVMKAFDVDMNDSEEVEMFTNWMQYRFKPFFLNTLTALFNVNPKINLLDAESKLKSDERVKFLEGAKFASSAAYEYSQPPVKSIDGSLASYKPEVMNIIDGLIKGVDSKSKSDSKSSTSSIMDKAKAAAGAVSGLGVVQFGKNALTSVKDSAIVNTAASVMSSAARGTIETGKELLKFLKDKDIPVAMKQTILGLGTSVMGSLPGVGNTLMKAAMVALGPGALLMEGAKKLLNSKTAQSLKSGIENLYQSTKDAVTPVIDSAKEKFSSAASTGKSFLGRTASFVSQSFDSAKNFVSKNYDKLLGFISSKYESGKKGVNTISSGQGDRGGVSYGRYQLASKNGSMSAFLTSPEGSKYAGQFQGLNPGTPQFNAKYAEIAQMDAEGFDKAQHEYIARTHYEPAFSKLQNAIPGLNLGKRSRAVQEAIFSTAVQYGPNSNVMVDALKGKDITNMTDEQIVSAIQDHKSQTVDSQFRSSSPAVRQSVANRIVNEKMDLIALARASNDSPSTSKTSALHINDKLDSGMSQKVVSPASNDNAYSAVTASALNHTQNGKYSLGLPGSNSDAGQAGLVKTSAGDSAVTPTAGDSSPAMSKTKTSATSNTSEIAAVSPTLSSKRSGAKRDDSGASAMSELIEASMHSNVIQSQQLNAMIEIRDLVKGIDDFMRARESKNPSAPPPPQRPKTPRAEPVEPIVDIRRKRSA